VKIRSAKQKGRKGQREVVDLIKKYLQLSDDDVKSTPASLIGKDILIHPRIFNDFPYSVEVKRSEQVKIWEWLKQCESNTGTKETPLLVFRRNDSEWYATLKFENLLSLLYLYNDIRRKYELFKE